MLLIASMRYLGPEVTPLKRRDFLQSATITAAGLLAADVNATPVQTNSDSPGAITDVQEIMVGHFTDQRRPTGCTVIIANDGATGGVDVRGAAPGTRETDL